MFSLVLAPLAACGGGHDSGKSSPVVESPPVVENINKDVPVVGPETKPSGEAKFGEQPKPVGEASVETPIPEKYEDCMTLGKSLAAKGEHARAREVFTAAMKLDKKKAEPAIELARSYIATNEKANAIKLANKAVKLAPESSQAYNTLGRAELLRHDYDAAVLAFRQATELNPDNVWAWNNLGLVHLTLKNYDEAVAALEQATSKKTAEGYMWNNLGLAYEQLDQLDDARDAFEHGAKLGSAVAQASRKRLEGVDSIKVAHATKAETKATKSEPKSDEMKTYDAREPMPEDIESGDESDDDELKVDVQVDDVQLDEPDDADGEAPAPKTE
ncbi:MAG TPA: tetratricopeptide repeat protein [Kofleriaceae bacterium]|nr:tetratricopeptide repeat protein [Kofleriaceae bacterium]